MKDLKEKAIKGFLWTGSGKFAEQVIRWTISIVLARLLAPSDYGLMALTSYTSYSLTISKSLVLVRDHK
jgi:O-antigen/teichoic acid export membrane protein